MAERLTDDELILAIKLAITAKPTKLRLADRHSAEANDLARFDLIVALMARERP